ncbi:MAG: hypothetical protein AAFZ87_00060 [Planctomycetota bacterium]
MGATAVPAAPQVDVVWNRALQAPPNTNTARIAVRPLARGGCYAVYGSLDPLGPPNRMTVNRVDSEGVTLWTQTFDVVGGGFDNAPRGLNVGPDDELVVLVSGATSSYRCIKLLRDGTLAFDRVIPLGAGEERIRVFDDPEVTPSGRILIAEFIEVTGAPQVRVVRSLDASGVDEWQFGLDGSFFYPYLAPAVDERAVVAVSRVDEVSVYAIDASGTLVWQTDKALASGASVGTVSTIDQNAAGEVAVLYSDSQPRQTTVLFLESDGQERYTRALGRYDFPDVPRMRLTSDGSVAYSKVDVPAIPGIPRPLVALGWMDPAGVTTWSIPYQEPNTRFDIVALDANDGPIVSIAVSTTTGDSPRITPYLIGFDRGGQPTWSFFPDFVMPTSIATRAAFGLGRPGQGYMLALDGTPSTGPLELVRFGLPEGQLGSASCGPLFPNSTSQFGALDAVGDARALVNDLTLVASRLPAGETTLFIGSRVLATTPTVPGIGSGLICLGGSIGRFDRPGEIRTTDAFGRTALRVDLAQLPVGTGQSAAMAGETWSFQAWHRDSAAATATLTEALSITLQ